ncbi:hypothetical protein BDP81DRAFT_104166 [Colletotrichum phormii]|uniref:Zn(2)-C6 fungal-type domain-containing protein n=1 Tax=Colletotrichum phormii TaxID=359342 RepID=A0AAJ0EAW1_9PEZI|nr:uncharacterized protein BDP81DRAFT_104166 [Colletotrichum phormii]KAK1624991.1 hypothetical protein BDP81DRAFT_104166 [Colletotrichum phormii]
MQCKKRKVKCDESRPVCFNCLRRDDVDCSFRRQIDSAGGDGTRTEDAPSPLTKKIHSCSTSAPLRVLAMVGPSTWRGRSPSRLGHKRRHSLKSIQGSHPWKRASRMSRTTTAWHLCSRTIMPSSLSVTIGARSRHHVCRGVMPRPNSGKSAYHNSVFNTPTSFISCCR